MPLIFEHLDEWRKLSGSVSDGDASELHGLICGLLSALPAASTEELLRALEPLGEWQWTADHRGHLQRGMLEFASAMDSSDFTFTPLLPADSAVLGERAACLGLWCGGFIAGFAAGQNHSQPQSPGAEQQEILNDLAQIARVDASLEGFVDHDDEEASDQAERAAELQALDQEEQEDAYFELLEYVRTAVMLMRQSGLSQLAERGTKPRLN